MASVLPTEVVTRVLNPIVKTGDFPVNQAAVKMMTKVADHAALSSDSSATNRENREFILANLHDIMPGLIKVRIADYKVTLISLHIKSNPSTNS